MCIYVYIYMHVYIIFDELVLKNQSFIPLLTQTIKNHLLHYHWFIKREILLAAAKGTKLMFLCFPKYP